jgi:hypothetical protein
MVDEPFFYDRIGREFSECAQWRREALHDIAMLKPDIVIVGSTHTAPFDRDQWIAGTTSVLQSIANASGHVYIMRSTPVLPFDGPSCLEPRSSFYDLVAGPRSCEVSARNEHADDVYRWLGEAAGHFHNVSRIDMNDVVCPQGQCSAERDGTIVFRDSQHLTAAFVQSVAGKLWEHLAQGGSSSASAAATVPQSSP